MVASGPRAAADTAADTTAAASSEKAAPASASEDPPREEVEGVPPVGAPLAAASQRHMLAIHEQAGARARERKEAHTKRE